MHTSSVAEDRSVLFRKGPTPSFTMVYGEHPDQLCDMYMPAAQSPYRRLPVVFLHGGYWRPEYDRSHARNAAGALAEAGWTTALAEYRRTPGNPDATVADVVDAIQSVSRSRDHTKVIIVGHSAGGHLALLVAGTPHLPIHATLALAPLSNLVAADVWDLDDGAVHSFLGTDPRERPDLDPSLLPRPDGPVKILHGQEDSIVPYRMSETYGSAVDLEVAGLPDTGHYEPIDPLSRAWTQVLQALESLEAEVE